MIEYLVTLLIAALFAFIIKSVYKLRIYNNLRHLLVSNLIFCIIGYSWDSFAVYRGYWQYKSSNLMLGNIPLEEFLFYIVIPYLILVIFKTASFHKATNSL